MLKQMANKFELNYYWVVSLGKDLSYSFFILLDFVKRSLFLRV